MVHKFSHDRMQQKNKKYGKVANCVDQTQYVKKLLTLLLEVD